jgi:hypothetical protein
LSLLRRIFSTRSACGVAALRDGQRRKEGFFDCFLRRPPPQQAKSGLARSL